MWEVVLAGGIERLGPWMARVLSNGPWRVPEERNTLNTCKHSITTTARAILQLSFYFTRGFSSLVTFCELCQWWVKTSHSAVYLHSQIDGHIATRTSSVR